MHTRGPWQFYQLRGDDGLGYIRPDPEDGHEIAHHGDMDRSREENIANGNLIAASPVMLAALFEIDRLALVIKTAVEFSDAHIKDSAAHNWDLINAALEQVAAAVILSAETPQ
jgi:hypothetical protein